MKTILLRLIKFYQKHISVHLPAMCKYYPTCSSYAVQAIEMHGAFKGLIMAILRILRCNPLFAGGYDPVPPKKTRGSHCSCEHEQNNEETSQEQDEM